MILRLTGLLLLLANAGYYAWSRSLLAAWGFAPAQQSEPQRLQQQIKPLLLRVLPPEEARRIELSAGGGRGAECLQAGPVDDARAAALRKALQAWPQAAWTLEAAIEPARWIVYMGKYPNLESVARKRAELRQRGVSYEALSNPGLEPGLSLGGFVSQGAAQQYLDQLTQRGVRTARVVQDRAELRGQLLKIGTVDESLRARLDELREPLAGTELRPCR